MNNFRPSYLRKRGYSLLELSIAMGLLGVVAGIVYTVLNGGMILFSKNIATNYSNLSVRNASMRLGQDLHQSVGRAELVGTNLQPVTSTEAPGVRFPLLLNSAASYVISNSSGSKTIPSGASTSTVSLKIPSQSNPPKVGDILVFPDINDVAGNTLTRKITAVTLGNPTTVTVKDLGVTLNISVDSPPDPTIIYIARLAAYCLVTTLSDTSGAPLLTEVRFYPDASDTSTYTVVNNNLTTYLPALASGDYVSPYGNGSVAVPAGPFTIYSSGPSDPGNAVRIALMSINTETGNRKFSGDRMLFDAIVPPKTLIVQSTNYN